MNYLKSIFQKKTNQNEIHQTKMNYSTIYDQNSLTVHLDDIKAIIKSEQKRQELYFRPTKSLLEQLKVLYTLHMMIISDQISDEDQLINCFSQGKVLCLYQGRLFASKIIISNAYKLLLQTTQLEHNHIIILITIIRIILNIQLNLTLWKLNFHINIIRIFKELQIIVISIIHLKNSNIHTLKRREAGRLDSYGFLS
ncbi:unnamed protein product [Paramecium sonneborni]|uniref:Uncharacterized protein n=1 Tax=Paramecium sonneborni TaxID=65129 RepID=A0A8S1MRX6_9CILI|nr:unnamed protein product [Paramecium sonneborni]